MPAIPYSRRNAPIGPRGQDSEVLRNRVVMYLNTISSPFKSAAWQQIARETGLPNYQGELDAFLRGCGWDTFVDCIAYITNGLPERQPAGPYSDVVIYPRRLWLEFVISAFDQAHVTFRIDAQGNPQPIVDAAFTELVDSTLDGLNDPPFANAKADILAALKHMKKAETLDEAIDSTFKAAENIFRMSSGADRLTERAEQYYRTQWADKLDLPEKNAVGRMIVSLCQWVNAAHNYRHADNQPKPTPPSRETAVWMISTGMSHIRWMAHVHLELVRAKACG